MTMLILLFAALIVLAGVALIIQPLWVTTQLEKYQESVVLHLLAVVVRLLLGAALVLQAGNSHFPHVIYVLGWISIIAALVLAVIGRIRFSQMMRWALRLAESYGRAAGVLATALGAFLIYAFT